MEKVALNNKLRENKATIFSVNAYSLKGHYLDIKSTSLVQDSEVICIQETWIEPDEENKDNLNLNGFSSHFTSIGKGKGIGTYYRDNFNFTQDVKKPNYQMSKVSSADIDVINIYRSSNAQYSFVDDLDHLICSERTTHIVGDFNICYNEERQSNVVKYLEKRGFRFVTQPS